MVFHASTNAFCVGVPAILRLRICLWWRHLNRFHPVKLGNVRLYMRRTMHGDADFPLMNKKPSLTRQTMDRESPTFPIQKPVLSPVEFAAYFGREKTYTYRLLYGGKIKCIQPGGGRILIPSTEVQRLLDEADVYNQGRN